MGVEEEMQIFSAQIALELIVGMTMKRLFGCVVVREPMGVRLWLSLTDAGCFQRTIGCRHVLLNMNGRNAESFRLIAEAVNQFIFRQEITQGRVNVKQIADRVFILKPVQSAYVNSTCVTSPRQRVRMKGRF
jgi:hypothetical protein